MLTVLWIGHHQGTRGLLLQDWGLGGCFPCETQALPFTPNNSLQVSLAHLQYPPQPSMVPMRGLW